MSSIAVAPALTGQDLARAVVELVEKHPDLHDQTDVTCRTTACLAGWTLVVHLGFGPGTDFSTGDTDVPRWDLTDHLGARDACEAAAKLLGVEDERFSRDVYTESDRTTAIENFKRLTGIAS